MTRFHLRYTSGTGSSTACAFTYSVMLAWFPANTPPWRCRFRLSVQSSYALFQSPSAFQAPLCRGASALLLFGPSGCDCDIISSKGFILFAIPLAFALVCLTVCGRKVGKKNFLEKNYQKKVTKKKSQKKKRQKKKKKLPRKNFR